MKNMENKEDLVKVLVDYANARISNNMALVQAKHIALGRMVAGDGKSIFTDKDREDAREFLRQHQN